MPNFMVSSLPKFQRKKAEPAKKAEKAKKANNRKTQTSTSSYLLT
jgi:hypothetical protein